MTKRCLVAALHPFVRNGRYVRHPRDNRDQYVAAHCRSKRAPSNPELIYVSQGTGHYVTIDDLWRLYTRRVGWLGFSEAVSPTLASQRTYDSALDNADDMTFELPRHAPASGSGQMYAALRDRVPST